MSSHNLVFLHGWGTSSRIWEQQAAYFSEKYEVTSPSVTLYPVPYTLYPILIGWSYGGMQAIEMVVAEPSRYKALVLVASSAKFSEGMSPVVIKNIMRNLKRNFDATMKDCYATFFSDKENDFKERFISEQALPDKGVTIEILRKLLTMDLEESLKKIKIPTLIIHGDKDKVCPIAGGKFLNDNIAGSRIAVIKDAGHMPFYTRPEGFNKILEGFLETLD